MSSVLICKLGLVSWAAKLFSRMMFINDHLFSIFIVISSLSFGILAMIMFCSCHYMPVFICPICGQKICNKDLVSCNRTSFMAVFYFGFQVMHNVFECVCFISG